MPWTFGALNTDDVNMTTAISAGGNNGQVLVTGWWRPTTLTAGRGLWSVGASTGAAIDTTTDELRLYIDRSTTDPEDVTTGVDLATGAWKFLAFFLSATDTGTAHRWRVWAGDIENAPVEVTVTPTVGASGLLAGVTTFVVGSRGASSSVAWEGDVDEVHAVISNTAPGVSNANQFAVNTAGVVTDDEAGIIYRRWVVPAWKGEFFERRAAEAIYIAARAGATAQRSGAISTPPNPALTVNGATISANGPPRPRWDTQPMRAMARR